MVSKIYNDAFNIKCYYTLNQEMKGGGLMATVIKNR